MVVEVELSVRKPDMHKHSLAEKRPNVDVVSCSVCVLDVDLEVPDMIDPMGGNVRSSV